MLHPFEGTWRGRLLSKEKRLPAEVSRRCGIYRCVAREAATAAGNVFAHQKCLFCIAEFCRVGKRQNYEVSCQTAVKFFAETRAVGESQL